jgi:eukaryotic-like serine/threonine-protein kinase
VRSNRTIAGIIMGLIFLLIVSSLLAYLTIQTRQRNATSAAATAQANATNQVFVQQTQQAQNAQQTATAIAVAAAAQLKAIQATATAITNSPALLRDALSGPDNNGWPDDGLSCAFANQRYVVNAHGTSTLQPCIAGASQINYADVALQVEVTLISGHDAGLIFRISADGSQFYDFEVTNQGQFYLRYRNNGKYTDLITPTLSSAIGGTNSQNTLLVIASGTDFRLFINHTFVGEVHDATFASGQIGVVAGTLTSNSGSASFTNLAVYKA